MTLYAVILRCESFPLFCHSSYDLIYVIFIYMIFFHAKVFYFYIIDFINLF